MISAILLPGEDYPMMAASNSRPALPLQLLLRLPKQIPETAATTRCGARLASREAVRPAWSFNSHRRPCHELKLISGNP